MDIRSRMAAFRLQAAQRLLYGGSFSWVSVARLLLWRAGGLRLDRQLFLMEPQFFTGLTPFYTSVLDAWKTLNHQRSPGYKPGLWLFEEPLFNNDLLCTTFFASATVKTAFIRAGVVKLGHLVQSSIERLSEATGIRSLRMLQNLVRDLCQSLPGPLGTYVQNQVLMDQWSSSQEYVFPSLDVSPAVGQWREESGLLLNVRTPSLPTFSTCSSKQLYCSCVKVLNLGSLKDVRESRWIETLASGSSPRGSWRVLYKPPVEKRMADIQWRIIHGALATNRYRARIDPSIGEGCPFCSESETLVHLVLSCPRLAGFFRVLQDWVRGLGEIFSAPLFIFGPKYSPAKRRKHVLLNCIFASAKLAIWKSRKNRLLGVGWTDATRCLRGLMAAQFL